MVTKIGTGTAGETYQGTLWADCIPRAPLRGDRFQDILEDQAYLQQYMTNVDLAGGAWGHGHQQHNSDSGVPLGWPLSSSDWPSWQYEASEYAAGEAFELSLQTLKLKPANFAKIDGGKRVLFRWPFYVQAMAASNHIRCMIRAGRNWGLLNPRFCILNTSFAQVANAASGFVPQTVGDFASPEGDDTLWWMASCQATTGNEYIAQITLDVHLVSIPDVEIFVMHILPQYFYNASHATLTVHPPVESWSNASNILTASAYTALYDTYQTTDYPLTSNILETAAKNSSYLYEFITGSPVAGKSSLTATAHNHDGTNTPTIPVPIVSKCLGVVPTSQSGGAGDINTWKVEDSGGYDEVQYGTAPTIYDPNSALTGGEEQIVHQCAVWCPVRASNPSATWSAIVYQDVTNASGIEVHVDCGTTPGATDTDTSNSTAVTTAGWKRHTDSITLVQGALNHITVSLKIKTKPSDTYRHFTTTGFAIWLPS